MATGTGNLPNQGMDAVPFTPITSQWGDEIIENIEALADGTGIGDGSITTPAIADGAVSFAKTTGIWWEELARATVNAATGTSVNIPQRKYLKIIVSGVKASSAGSGYVTFNNDTNNNYARRALSANAAGTSTVHITLVSHIQVAQSSSNNAVFMAEIDVSQIAQNQMKPCVVNGGAENGDSRTGLFTWTNTTDFITSVQFGSSSGNTNNGEIIVLGHD